MLHLQGSFRLLLNLIDELKLWDQNQLVALSYLEMGLSAGRVVCIWESRARMAVSSSVSFLIYHSYIIYSGA